MDKGEDEKSVEFNDEEKSSASVSPDGTNTNLFFIFLMNYVCQNCCFNAVCPGNTKI